MNLRNFFHQAAIAASFVLTFTVTARAAVSLGIDELEKSNFAVLAGKRVGLVTNPSGADTKGRSAIDVLYNGQNNGQTAGYHLLKLFGPEHGINGLTGAGDPVANSRDHKTHLPVYSLFITPQGNYRHPTREMFAGLDVVVYDVQDLGNRSYTFISTLGYVMDEAAKDNVQVIVLDRPNPLGGVRIEGPRLDSSFKPSFVGLYDIPYIYGLTPGELAEWINAKYLDKPCKLTVIAMRGWTRPMVWEDTGLKWVPTSPNIPTIAAARGYTATGFLGEIGIESGCGSPKAFQIVQNGRCSGDTFASRFNSLHVPGIHAKPIDSGIYLEIDPRNAGNLTAVNFQAIEILEDIAGNFSPFGRTDFDQRDMFDKISGTTRIRRQLVDGRPVSDIIRSWDSGVARWASERQPYLIYGMTPAKPAKASGIVADIAPPSP